MVPFGLVSDIVRDGWAFTFVLRGGLAPVVVTHLARRADELASDVARARAACSAAGDGWAVAGGAAAVPDTPECGLLASLAGPAALRVGVKSQARGEVMPFVLAPVGGRVAVESAGDEARATFVFETSDVDRLNAALLLTSFRREALFLPEDRLGRWSTAVRLLPVVRWARGALVARVVHDAQWETNVRAALEGSASSTTNSA
jgi:hypothetical protein